MAPPAYADLGKPARDLFNRGYNHGFMKLDCTTKTESDLEFKTGASQNIATGKLFGNVELRYKIPEYGVTLTERWNTDNTLGSEITMEDKMTKGLKLTFDSSFAPQLGKRTGKIRGEYAHNNIRLNSDLSLDFGGPLVNADGVVCYEGWLLGYQTGFDTQRSKLIRSNIGLGRQGVGYTVHTFVNDSSEFGGSIHHKVNDNLELAANLGWTTGEQTSRFGLAGKYQLDRDTVVRAKVNNASQAAFGITHSLSRNLKVTVSSLVNMQNFSEGGHKVGFGIEYDSA